jgi:hypothetical protein
MKAWLQSHPKETIEIAAAAVLGGRVETDTGEILENRSVSGALVLEHIDAVIEETGILWSVGVSLDALFQWLAGKSVARDQNGRLYDIAVAFSASGAAESAFVTFSGVSGTYLVEFEGEELRAAWMGDGSFEGVDREGCAVCLVIFDLVPAGKPGVG